MHYYFEYIYKTFGVLPKKVLRTNFQQVVFVKSATNCGSKCTSECGTYLWSLEGGVRRRQGLQPTVSKKQPMDEHIVSDCVIVNAIGN